MTWFMRCGEEKEMESGGKRLMWLSLIHISSAAHRMLTMNLSITNMIEIRMERSLVGIRTKTTI